MIQIEYEKIHIEKQPPKTRKTKILPKAGKKSIFQLLFN